MKFEETSNQMTGIELGRELYVQNKLYFILHEIFKT